MLINELAKQTELSIHTIRYYENLGLIRGIKDPQVRTNNYKHYDQESMQRLEIIKEAKQVGLTLAQTRDLLKAWFENNQSKTQTRKIFETKILEIDKKMAQFRQIKKRLKKVLDSLDQDAC